MASRSVGSRTGGRVLLAFDKFKGTASARELVAATAVAAERQGWRPVAVPLADGGEGSLDVLGGPNKVTRVAGPLGEPVDAGWRQEGAEAFIEMAAASGLTLVGGPEANDPLRADTAGTGQLIAAAVERGCRRITVLLGGSATTDGGWAALQTMPPAARLKGVELIVACDVETRFVDAARVFGPQKGASPAQVEMLTRRLERLVDLYKATYDFDVTDLVGGGAAGGLAGGLAAVGGQLMSGLDAVAEWSGLDDLLDDADLVVTGEGRLDATSFDGKVVGGVVEMAVAAGVPVLVVVGEVSTEIRVTMASLDPRCTVVSLSRRFGRDEALASPAALCAAVLEEVLEAR